MRMATLSCERACPTVRAWCPAMRMTPPWPHDTTKPPTPWHATAHFPTRLQQAPLQPPPPRRRLAGGARPDPVGSATDCLPSPPTHPRAPPPTPAAWQVARALIQQEEEQRLAAAEQRNRLLGTVRSSRAQAASERSSASAGFARYALGFQKQVGGQHGQRLLSRCVWWLASDSSQMGVGKGHTDPWPSPGGTSAASHREVH
jgi:hypothetical protein